MRTIGFLGIALLLAINVFGTVVAINRSDWKGIAFMLFMAAMLIVFARMLWLGRRFEREARSGRTLARGWYGESVSAFFTNQVSKSPEGRVLLVGSCISLALAIASLVAPAAIGLPANRGITNAVLFGMWPILAFVLYVRICGPTFNTSIVKIVAMLALVAVPVLIAYR